MFEFVKAKVNRFWGGHDVENQNGSSSGSVWSYAQTLLKGVGLVAVGGMAYTFFRSSVTTPNSISQDNELTITNKNAEVNLFQQTRNLADPNFLAENNMGGNLAQVLPELTYRSKRDAVPVTGEIQVVTNGNLTQSQNAALATFSNGEFVIVWQSQTGAASSMVDIFGQRFASDGTKLGVEFQINTILTNQQNNPPAIASFPDDKFITVWNRNFDIWGQILSMNATKIGGEFLINAFTNDQQQFPKVAVLTNGNAVVTWSSNNQVSGSSSSDIFAQFVASNGTKISNEFLVNTFTNGLQFGSEIAKLTNDKFVIVWSSNNQLGDGFSHLYGQLFNNNSTRVGGEFLANTNTSYSHNTPKITSLANNQFLVNWQVPSAPVQGQLFSNDGVKIGLEFDITNTTAFSPSNIGFSNGPFITTWTSSSDIYAQRFGSDASKIDNKFLVNTNVVGTQQKSVGAALSDTQFVIAWESGGSILLKIFTLEYALPLLLKNTLSLDQGQSVTINSNNLLANSGGGTDFYNLLFLASDTTSGNFEKVNNPGVAVFNFTQNELVNDNIRFVHDDSYMPPSYKIAVYDGVNTTTPAAVTLVNFDKKPLFIANNLLIANGKEIQLSPNEILATDDRNNSIVFFNVLNVTRGFFSAVIDTFATPIFSFSQAQINTTQIRFTHDGSNIAPTYAIKASDGRLVTNYFQGQISFTPNVAPSLSVNQLTIVKGERRIFDGTNLAINDPDSDISKLVFEFDAIKNGNFELTSNPGQKVINATQVQITAGQLLFKHDGSDNSPSYNVIATDGIDFSAIQAANVTFFLQSPGNNSAVIGGAVGGTGAALLLAGAGIFGAYRYRQNKRLANERTQHPLANAIYEALKINGVDDFQSDKGIAFVNAVNALDNELSLAGIDTKQMIPDETNELAEKLKTAILAKLSYKKEFSGIQLNPLDIQDKAAEIVALGIQISTKLNRDDTNIELAGREGRGANLMLLYKAIGNQLRGRNIDLHDLSVSDIETLAERFVQSAEMVAKPSL